MKTKKLKSSLLPFLYNEEKIKYLVLGHFGSSLYYLKQNSKNAILYRSVKLFNAALSTRDKGCLFSVQYHSLFCGFKKYNGI